MIVETNIPFIFITRKILNAAFRKGRTKIPLKHDCVFIKTEEPAYETCCKDLALYLAGFLKLDVKEFLQVLEEFLKAEKDVVAIKCLDGYLVHPKALAKLIKKLSKRLLRELENPE